MQGSFWRQMSRGCCMGEDRMGTRAMVHTWQVSTSMGFSSGNLRCEAYSVCSALVLSRFDSWGADFPGQAYDAAKRSGAASGVYRLSDAPPG